jgi:hypothetical protein
MAKHDCYHHGVRKDQTVVGLIDGDIVAVRSAAVFQAQDGFEEDHLYALVRKTIREWTSFCDESVVCMSLGKSFRYGPYPQYKSNRTQEKPRGTDEAKAYLRANYRILEYEGLEADDCMGISATEPQDETVRIIISTDKDMLQIPGWQFNPDKDRFPHKPTVEQADAFLDFQVCCGDPGDGYPGVPGVGIAKYRKWVQAYGGCLFEKNGLSPEYKESMVACAKILRWEDKPHDWPTTY